MTSPEREKIIETVYNDPETGFGSLRDTYRQANAKDPGIRYVDVKRFLDRLPHRQTQTTYRGHNSWVSPGLLFEIELDLVDLTATAEENGGFRYALVGVDNFSKFAHVVPVRGKTPADLVPAVEEIFDKVGTPKQVYSDYEGAFESKPWLRLMNARGVKVVQTVSAAHGVERLNRTLKGMLQTRLDAQGLKRWKWVSEVPAILRKYNSSVHSTTGMSPNQAKNPANELAVAWALHSKAVQKRRYPELSKGDRVRVLLKKDHKTKGYMPKWSAEVYKVSAVDGSSYLVLDGKRRLYQRHELLKVA